MQLVTLHQPEDVRRLVRDKLEQAIENIFPRLQQLHNRAWHGAYLVLGDRVTGFPFLTAGMGSIPLEKQPKYYAFSAEKSVRLGLHPEHRTSYQSRNDDVGQYPGAIRGRRMIYSPSGMPWELDESFGLLVAHRLDDITLAEAFEMAEISKNPLFERAAAICLAA